MERSRLDPIPAAKEPSPADEAGEQLGPLERAARIADIKDRMMACLDELDRLGLRVPGNYLSHAIALCDEDR